MIQSQSRDVAIVQRDKPLMKKEATVSHSAEIVRIIQISTSESSISEVFLCKVMRNASKIILAEHYFH